MMKKIFVLLLLLSMSSMAYAGRIIYGTTYAPNGVVTNINLNGNFNNVSNVVNGGLDNTNADTTNGYRFFQTVSVLPAAGSQGAVYFLTSDNSLNFDTGGGFVKSVAILSPVQGDVIYYGASGWNALTPGTSGQVFVTQGPAANPLWVTPTYSALNVPYVKASETQSSGVSGQTSLSTGSFLTVILNTKDNDTQSIASLSSNEITLPAGTYKVDISVPLWRTGASQAILFNVTGSTTLLNGTSEDSANGGSFATSHSTIKGIITLAGSTALAVKVQVGSSSGAAIGIAASYGTEVYTIAEFTKIA